MHINNKHLCWVNKAPIKQPDENPKLLWTKLNGRGSLSGGAKLELWVKIGEGKHYDRYFC